VVEVGAAEIESDLAGVLDRLNTLVSP